jgi:hypothetical protein
MSNIIGIRNNNTIVPYAGATKRTKEYVLTVTGTGWTTVAATGFAYADSAGKWRLVFNFTGAISPAATTITVAIAGVTFLNVSGFSQSCAMAGEAGKAARAFCQGNTGNITLDFETGLTYGIASGDVALNTEPTWAAANMEGVTAVDVYIAPQVPGVSAGLVPAQGLDGRTDGVAVPAGKVGEKIAWAGIDTASTLTDGAGAAEVGNGTTRLTCGLGIYLVSYYGDGAMAATILRCVHTLAVQSGTATVTQISTGDAVLQTDGGVPGTALALIGLYYVIVTAPAVFKVTGSASGGNVTSSRIRSGAAIRIA